MSLLFAVDLSGYMSLDLQLFSCLSLRELRYLLIFLALGFYEYSFAQSNGIIVTLDSYDFFEDGDSLTVYLKKDNRNIDSIGWSDYEDIRFDSLPDGVYSLFVEHVSGRNTRYDGLLVHYDSIMEVIISPWYYSNTCLTEDCNECSYQRVESYFTSLYTSDFFDEMRIGGFGMSHSIGGIQWTDGPKHFNVGALIGGYYDFFRVDNPSLSILEDADKERISNFGLEIGGVLRYSTYNLQTPLSRGFFTELGVRYKLPVAARYVGIQDGLKVSQKSIHQFKDFRFFLRSGHSPVAIQLEYRALDFIDSPLPELPKWSIGLSFVLED